MADPGEHVSTGDKAQARASEMMDEVRSRAGETVRSTAKKGEDLWDNQKRLIAVEVDGYACALREAARMLHDQAQHPVANYAERAADGLDHFAHNLREKEIGSMVNRVTDFAQRQPAVFLGGAVAIGFMLSRFLKSSSVESSEYEPWEKEPTEHAEPMEYPSPPSAGYSASESGPYTAADVEIPVILQPRGDSEHKGDSEHPGGQP